MPSMFNLTDAAQKQLSFLQSKISVQKTLIIKEQAVIESKGDTYICNRARTSLASYKSKMSKIEDERKRILKELEEKEEKLERDIELQEKIIWEETHRKSPNIIRAEKEMEVIQKQIDNIMLTNTPLTQAPVAQVVPDTQEIVFDFGEEGMDEEEEIRKRRIATGLSPEATSTYLDWNGYKTPQTIYGAVSSLERR